MGQAVSSDASELCLGWLHQNVHSLLSSKAKYLRCQSRRDTRLLDSWWWCPSLNCLSDLLLAIQPIPTSDVATWGRVEAYLVNTLQRDIGAFSRVFFLSPLKPMHTGSMT